MQIRRFEPEDLNALDSWLMARGEPLLGPEFLPEVGMIVPGVAAGFLYRAEGKMALLEHFVTNRTESRINREEAVSLIADSLVEIAKAEGFSVVVAITRALPIIKHCDNKGFKCLGPHGVYLKEIK